MSESAQYWLRDKPTQNFGDFLSAYFMAHLFYPALPPERVIRVVGSCIDDMFIPAGQKIIFWGCGLRTPDGVSDENRNDVEILSVRGPLSRSALRLGNAVPVGDPGLLLPAIYRPKLDAAEQGRALLVPHFHDSRSDDELLTLSGCASVLRPNIGNTLTAIEGFIDTIATAEFVLGASMHSVIAAIAYGRPFSFWDSGKIDLPFKWQDLAASLGIPCAFHETLDAGRLYHAQSIAPALRIPPLWPMLVVAPAPVKPEILVRVIELDIERHGPEVLQQGAAVSVIADVKSRFFTAVEEYQTERTAIVNASLAMEQAQSALERQLALVEADHRKGQALIQQLRADLALREDELDREKKAAEVHRFEVAMLEAHIEQMHGKLQLYQSAHGEMRAKLERQAGSLEKLESGLRRYAHAEERLRVELHQVRDTVKAMDGLHATLKALKRSASWRLTRPLRKLHSHFPMSTRRLAQFGSALAHFVTLRIVGDAFRRRRKKTEMSLLKKSPLFDGAWYLKQHNLPPGTKPHRHIVQHGFDLGFEAHPLFDVNWYLTTNPAVAEDRAGAFAYYLAIGAAAGHDPHPLFDTKYYLSQLDAPLPAGTTALEHYLSTGSRAGLWPNELFDPQGYRFEHQQRLQTAAEPLTHYIVHGEHEGLDPHPEFSTVWYREQNPRRGGLSPLAHFLRVGRAQGLAPSPLHAFFEPRVSSGAPLEFPDHQAPTVSIVVPAYGRYFETYRCLLALMHNTDKAVPYEVILADDRPEAPIVPLLAHVPNLRAHLNKGNLGFLRSCNRAVRHARGRYVVFLNNDTTVRRNWLAPMVKLLEDDPLVAVVGAKLIQTDGRIQEAGGTILSNGWGRPNGAGEDPAKGEYNFVREVDVVTGACFIIRREAFEAIGGFDDRYAPAFYEEFDLAIALRTQGWRTVYQPASEVVHHGSASYGPEKRDRQSQKNHAQFIAKWQTLLGGQPTPRDSNFVASERPALRGTILVIDDKVPEYDKHAGGVTLIQYLTLMRELGLKVVFHPQDGRPEQPYADVLQQMGIEVIHAPDTLDAWLLRNGEHVDYVWTARPDVTFPILELLRRTTGALILYYTHDLHYLRQLRQYELDGSAWALDEFERLKPMELGIFASVDRVMTPSAEEAHIIRTEVPDAHVTVIPAYFFPPSTLPCEAGLRCSRRDEIIFVGGFDHPPNVDAAVWLVQEIMPIVWREMPHIRLLIVGNAPPTVVTALASGTVEVTGFVPDLAPFFARARLSVNPLRFGAGVKGKIVSALQRGVPVVTTSCGNEGIGLRDGIEALIADDAAGIAGAILALCRDEALCRALAAAAAAVLGREFSERRARRTLLHLLGDNLCPVCGTRPSFGCGPSSNWREAFACDLCKALNRTAAVADVVLAPYRQLRLISLRQARPLLARLKIHEFSIVGPIVEILMNLPNFTSSEFFDDVQPGDKTASGIMCQDMQALTFANDSFDLLISQEVLEHVPDPEAAFRETFRVLRPGGRHIFSIPFSPDAEHSARRARLTAGEVKHLLPAVYHGDPLREQGALVFTDFGADLPNDLRALGFDVILHPMASPDYPSFVFETIKREPTAEQAHG